MRGDLLMPNVHPSALIDGKGPDGRGIEITRALEIDKQAGMSAGSIGPGKIAA